MFAILAGVIGLIIYYTSTQEGKSDVQELKSAINEVESSYKSVQNSHYEKELKDKNILTENEKVIFCQFATYKGGILGYPEPIEKVGNIFILSHKLAFYDEKKSWKLAYKKIIDTKLEFFKLEGIRSLLAVDESQRQELQRTKNILSITYLDNKNIERNAKFQIHGSLTIPGEERKATEFLNHLLEFKEHFFKNLNKAETENDAISKLEELKTLKDKNIITEEEFNRKKSKLLDEI